MKIVNEVPTDGQFLAIWKHDGVVWSQTYRWIEGKCHLYYNYLCDECYHNLDEFIQGTSTPYFFPSTQFVISEDTDKEIPC